MAASRYKKTLRTVRKIDTDSGSATVPSKILCNKDLLTSEIKLAILVTQAFVGVPTSSDVRDFISEISLELTGGSYSGKIFTLDGQQCYDLNRITEASQAPIVTLAATSVAYYTMELHLEEDESLNDLDTALRSGDYTAVNLRVNWAADATNGFKGGVTPSPATYSIAASSVCYPDLTPITDSDKMLATQGSKIKKTDSFFANVATVGVQPKVQLTSGGKTRFVMITTRNAAGVLANGILGDIAIKRAGETIREVTFAELQQENARSRGFGVFAGVAFLDFGDDPDGYMYIDPKVKVDFECTSLAAGTFKITQDQVV
jgi:hypothetical protein